MSKVYIIAEAGVNHNGDLKKAKALIQEAKKVGADAVKFQYYKTENLVLKKTPKTNYQKKNEKKFKNQFDMLKKYELSKYHLVLLQRTAKKLKIESFMVCNIPSEQCFNFSVDAKSGAGGNPHGLIHEQCP